MTALDDSFPVYPTAAPAPAPTPEAAPATEAPPSSQPAPPSPPAPDLEAKPHESPADMPTSDIVQTVPEPATSPAPAETPPLITPEQISELSSDITEDIVDTVSERKNPSDDVRNGNDSPATAHTIEVKERAADSFHGSAEKRINALHARQAKRDAKLARIIESARNRGSIRNDEIKKILRVSDATATRYARMLVQRGDLIQTGKGRSIRYTPRS